METLYFESKSINKTKQKKKTPTHGMEKHQVKRVALLFFSSI